MSRVAVFVDYQNAYHGSRRTFGVHGSPVDGQIDPRALGELLVRRGLVVDDRRQLDRVMAFRGRPVALRDPTGSAAAQRQAASWSRNGVVPMMRPLRYRRAGSRVIVEEKGIDVLIALQMALGAVRDEYDVAILLSADTDLAPAVDVVIDVGKRCEVATWDAGARRGAITVPGRRVWCHWLDRDDYLAVADPTDYRRPIGGASG